MSSTKKRKSESIAASAAKKAKLDAQAQVVTSILSDASSFELPEDDETIRTMFVRLAQYARGLEEEVMAMRPKERSSEDLAAAAEKLANAAKSGIKKQMTWRPTAKQGRAKWSYDGVCNDPAVFGAMLNLVLPVALLMRLSWVPLFHSYGTLRATSDINITWKPEDGTFKFSGTYGL
ncbi:hypothetical protein NLJ89_g10587 [Agrocybe chaxingu]|uniref:Uncharacterized protein n=1 Tax=Agrocybe chaxingu TaxID=84603 RepID=A0A9W8MNS7_9AGAR|nr:hypothetical protein NLJ89_g10587 [Agrocybe chaxingu]